MSEEAAGTTTRPDCGAEWLEPMREGCKRPWYHAAEWGDIFDDTPDPYDQPVYVRYRLADMGHMHSEPVCAFPDCETYLTRAEMAELQARQVSHE